MGGYKVNGGFMSDLTTTPPVQLKTYLKRQIGPKASKIF